MTNPEKQFETVKAALGAATYLRAGTPKTLNDDAHLALDSIRTYVEELEVELIAAQFYDREFVASMSAENTRLREALEQIAALPKAEVVYSDEGTRWQPIAEAKGIARAALDQRKAKT